MNSVVNQIRQSKAAHSADELRRLSNGLATLQQLDKLREVDSQVHIVGVIGKVPNYIRNHWKHYAVETKCNKGDYPGFGELVHVLENEVDEATDPKYGKPSLKPAEKFDSNLRSRGQGHRSSTASLFSTKVTVDHLVLCVNKITKSFTVPDSRI